MRYSQSEKMQIIRLVEESPVSVKQTLLELNINRSTFYKWYRRYQEGGFEALANRYRSPKQFWNAIPPWEKQRVVETALDHPENHPVNWPGTLQIPVGIIFLNQRYTGY